MLPAKSAKLPLVVQELCHVAWVFAGAAPRSLSSIVDRREANRAVWGGLSGALWTDEERPRWTKLAWCSVVAHGVFLLTGLWELYAFFVARWEKRLIYGCFILMAIMMALLLRALLKTSHPQRGALVVVSSFRTSTEKELKEYRQTRWLFTGFGIFFMSALIFTLVGGLFGLPDVTALDPRLHADNGTATDLYGGHGGTAEAKALFAAETIAMIFTFPCMMGFLYSLNAASGVAMYAAVAVVDDIDEADNDAEANVAAVVLEQIGPSVQTLVEEVLVPLSSGWSLSVAVSVSCFLFFAVLNVPVILDPLEPEVQKSQVYFMAGFCCLYSFWIVSGPAFVTTKCADIASELNELRTTGKGSGKGMVHRDTGE